MTVLLVIFYLFLPVMGFAYINSPVVDAPGVRSIDGVVRTPCEHCPCSDEQGDHCCDTTFCSCGFHSPSVQGVLVRYVPVVTTTRYIEYFCMLPQVYRPIFVPPQNQSQAVFLMS